MPFQVPVNGQQCLQHTTLIHCPCTHNISTGGNTISYCLYIILQIITHSVRMRCVSTDKLLILEGCNTWGVTYVPSYTVSFLHVWHIGITGGNMVYRAYSEGKRKWHADIASSTRDVHGAQDLHHSMVRRPSYCFSPSGLA